MQSKKVRWGSTGAIAVAIVVVVSGCSGGATATAAPSVAPSAVVTAAPTPSPVAGVAASSAPSAAATSSPAGPGGPASLDAPPTVGIGGVIEVKWTGPNAAKDYITIVPVGAAKWTNESYVYTTTPSPAKLPAPAKLGDYEIWYVNGADDVPSARRPISVTNFAGTLDAPAEIEGGSPIQVAWTGPNGPGDYITVVKAGAEKWTNESYFYTAAGSTGSLQSAIEPGAYEIWYVTGQDPLPQIKRPITIKQAVVTLDAPAKVKANADFQVKWTGPNGARDYITIVPKGSADGTYASYAYTATGNPVTIHAPAGKGDYEIWYASDRVRGVFGRIPIIVE